MTGEERKTIVRRFREEVWNQGRLEAVDELCAPDYMHHLLIAGVLSSRDILKRVVARVQHPTPALHFTIEELRVDGEAVTERWLARRRDRDRSAPSEPVVRGIDLYHVVAGQITRKVGDWEHLRLTRLGDDAGGVK